jgi:hypothetical protein
MGARSGKEERRTRASGRCRAHGRQ